MKGVGKGRELSEAATLTEDKCGRLKYRERRSDRGQHEAGWLLLESDEPGPFLNNDNRKEKT